MELRITTPLEPGSLPEIQWNHEELKIQIQEKAREYANIAYTDSQEKEMRADRASLNKLVTAFENERKKVKKFYAAPYEKFDSQVKEILAPVRDAIGIMDKGLGEIERQYRVEKTNRMRELYDEMMGDLRGIIPFEKTICERCYLKSYTDKNLRQHYMDLSKKVRRELDELEQLPEHIRPKAAIEYGRELDLGKALQEGRRIAAQERELEKRLREQAQAKEQPVPEPSRPDISRTEAKEEKSSQEAAPVLTLDFRVWGTREQILGIRQYLLDNQIKFGKVE